MWGHTQTISQKATAWENLLKCDTFAYDFQYTVKYIKKKIMVNFLSVKKNFIWIMFFFQLCQATAKKKSNKFLNSIMRTGCCSSHFLSLKMFNCVMNMKVVLFGSHATTKHPLKLWFYRCFSLRKQVKCWSKPIKNFECCLKYQVKCDTKVRTLVNATCIQ